MTAIVARGTEVPELSVVLGFVALTLAWIATRPLHPPIPPLYRARLRSAWGDWVDELERWNDREDERAFEETERATAGLVERLRGMKPPASERADHEQRVAALTAYADALAAGHAAQRAGDSRAIAAAAERLHAAREALG